MSHQRVSDTSLLPVSSCLGHTCGTNIDTEGVFFTNKQPNLVYVDKVFSFNQNTASPILFDLNTSGANANNFTVRLTLCNGLFPCTLSPNAVFEIDNSFVAVEYFNTRPPGNITASQVTVDGFPVDSVTFSNGQYTAVTANVLTRVQNEMCLDRGLPTKTFFMITGAGPWDLRATYVLEGTVNTNGRTCRFRAEISNAPGAPNTMLPGGSLSSFAIRNLSLPCTVNGVSPLILFQFNARVSLVNPRLTVNCGVLGTPENCTVSLVSTVAVDPTVHVESIRRTLFCMDACEGVQPCQGSVTAAEAIEDTEDCEIGGIDRPDCRCTGHKNRDRNCRNTRDQTAGEESAGEEATTRRIRRGRRQCNGSELLGSNDRAMLKSLLAEVCDELAEDTSEVGEEEDMSTRRRSPNGCSW